MSNSFLPNFQETATEPVPVAPIQSAQAAPVTQAAPLTNSIGETVSPELLAELKAYIERMTVDTVSQAVTTIVPDVVEATLARVQSSAPVPVQQPAAQLAAPATDDFDDYMPGRYQGRRPSEQRRDWVAWLAMGGIVIAMTGAIAVIATTATPSASTDRVVKDQGNQIQQKDLLIKDLADQASKSNCKMLCF